MIGAFLLLAALGVDPRVTEAQQLAAHGDDGAALAGLQSVLSDVEQSGDSGSAALHQNIGTLALKTGDLGVAARHLLAAERRDPRNGDVQHNLRLLREARADRIEGAVSSSPGRSLPPGATRVAAAVAFALAGVLLLLRGLLGRRLPGVLVVIAVGAAAIAFFVFVVRLRFEGEETWVILTETQARAAADEKATGFAVHPGLTGVLVQRSGLWLQLRLENGIETFVAAKDASPVP